MKKIVICFCLVASLIWTACGPLRSDLLELKLMSFNIRYGTAKDGEHQWENRKDLVMSVIRDYEPDFVGLQEALRFQIDEIREALPGYGEVGVARQGGTEGEYSAILYKLDRFSVTETQTFWMSDTPEVPSTHWGNTHLRICTWGLFEESGSGKSVYIYNTHYDHKVQESREKSSRLLASRIAERAEKKPYAIMGDFNAGEDNSAIEFLTKGLAGEGGRVVDAFRILNPDAVEVGTFNGFKGKNDGNKIDYVFVEKDTQVLEASIVRQHDGARYPSDHYPVTAQVRMNAD